MALVLNRKRGEVIRIGDDIFVRIVEADRGRATLAIEAPPQVKILRAELRDKEMQPRPS